MGRSVATPSNSVKNLFVRWIDAYVREDHPDEHVFAWNDFTRDVLFAVNQMSGEFEEPREETWLEDEIRLLAQHGQARITVSEYCGMACVSLVPVKRTYRGAWGAERNRAYPLSQHYCAKRTEAFTECMKERFDVYIGGAYASNGSRMYHAA